MARPGEAIDRTIELSPHCRHNPGFYQPGLFKQFDMIANFFSEKPGISNDTSQLYGSGGASIDRRIWRINSMARRGVNLPGSRRGRQSEYQSPS